MLALTVACGVVGWLDGLGSLERREGGGYTLSAAAAAGSTVLTVPEEAYLHPVPYGHGLSGVNALVKTLYDKKSDATVKKWLASFPAIDKNGAFKKLIIDKRNTKPIPAHASNELKHFRTRVAGEYKALMETQKLGKGVPEADYLELREFVAAHSWNLNGSPLMIPGLHPLDFFGVTLRFDPEDASVKFVAAKDYAAGDVLADPVGDAFSVPQKIFRYHKLASGDLDHDCYPVNLADRWGGKVPSIPIPEEVCVKKGEMPESLLRSFALGSMSDAKVAKGCAEKTPVEEVFKCVGTADFEQRTLKKAATFFKNEITKNLGEEKSKPVKEFAAEAAKLPSDPLTPFIASQREILNALVADFGKREEAIDRDMYKQLAAERKEEEKRENKEKSSSAKEEEEGEEEEEEEPKKSSKKKKGKKKKDSKKKKPKGKKK